MLGLAVAVFAGSASTGTGSAADVDDLKCRDEYFGYD